MNETIAPIIEREIARAKTQGEFAMLQRLVEGFYTNGVISDFDTLCELKTRITLAYMDRRDQNEKEGR